MARPRTFRHNVWLRLTPLENSLVQYYASTFGRDQTQVIRGMLKQYVRADANFDPKKFKKFVDQQILPEAKSDQDLTSEIKHQTEEFLAQLAKRR